MRCAWCSASTKRWQSHSGNTKLIVSKLLCPPHFSAFCGSFDLALPWTTEHSRAQSLVPQWKCTTSSARACWNPHTKNVWRVSLTCEEFIDDRQRAVPVVYIDVKLDCGYRMDLVVEGQVVVELKAVENLAKIHEAIVLTYLRLSGCRIGLLINFNVLTLKEGIRRFRI